MTDDERKYRDEPSESGDSGGEHARDGIEWEIETTDLDEHERKVVPETETQPETEHDYEGGEEFEEDDLPRPGVQIPEPVHDPEVEAAKAEKMRAEAEEDNSRPEEREQEDAGEFEIQSDSEEDEDRAGQKPEPERTSVAGPEPAGAAGATAAGAGAYDSRSETGQMNYGDSWNWREVRSGFKPFLFDHMSELHRFSKGRIDKIDDPSQMSGYFTYLAHHEESHGQGLLTLNTESKYAKVVARKNLEEMGELSPEGILKIFDTRKTEGGQVNVFYEVLPRDRHISITESYRKYAPGFIIHDSLSLLFGLLKRAGRGMHALALHLPGTIILIGGRNGDVYLSRQYALVGDDDQAMIEGIHAMSQDLSAMERNLGQKLNKVDWIEAMAHDLDMPKPAVEIPISPWPLHKFTFDGREVWSSLPTAVSRSKREAALGPKEEKYLRPLERAEKYVWAVLLALAVVAGIGFYSVMEVSDDMQSSIRAMRNRMNAMEAQFRERSLDTEFSALEPTLELAKDFRKAAVSPPYGQMWNYLAVLKPEDVRVDALEFDYQPEVILVRMEGEVQRDLSASQYLYNGFLQELENAGFEILTQHLDLDVEGNFYSMNLSWPLKTE